MGEPPMDETSKRAAAALALVSQLIVELAAKGVLTLAAAQTVTDRAAVMAEEFAGAGATAIMDDLTAALNLLRGLPGAGCDAPWPPGPPA
jgi:hypothetical protein